MMLSIQIAKFKFCQYQLRAVSPNLMLTKMIRYTVCTMAFMQIRKVIQLYETMLVRHGLMCVGPTGGGKTAIYEILKDALTNLHKDGHKHYFYCPVHTYVLNPKVRYMCVLKYESWSPYPDAPQYSFILYKTHKNSPQMF